MNINDINQLKAFIEKWAGPRLAEYGLSEDEIPEDLPKPLKEIYLFAGNWPHPRDNDDKCFQSGKQPRIFQEQDCLLGVNNLERKNGMITFLHENQGNWSCEVEENNDKSAVYSNSTALYERSDKESEIICDSIEHFLITFCLQELTFSSKIVGTIEEQSVQDIVCQVVEPLWLNGYYVQNEPTHSFCICKDILIMDVYGDFWCACNDEKALDLLRDKKKVEKIW